MQRTRDEELPVMLAKDFDCTRHKFVLVHGAFHGAWCWAPVAKHLRAQNHLVYTPTQTGLADRKHLMSPNIDMETFVMDVLNVIESEELDNVVLVGHSYGARSITGVVDRIPGRIARLIYLDGGLPINGKSRLDSTPEPARSQRIESSANFDGGISVPPPHASAFGIVDPQLVAWVNRRITPQPFGVEKSAVKLDNAIGNGRPVTYVRCIDPPFPTVRESADYARSQSGWRFIEFSGCHDAMITHPKEVAELLVAEANVVE